MKMRKTEIREAIKRLEELKETIYEAIDEMEEILREVAPGECKIAEKYWLAHIDEALGDRGRWIEVSYADTILALEELELEEMMKEEQEN